MIFSEKEGLKLDAVHKYEIIVVEESVSVERDWMKTCPGRVDYLRNGKHLYK